MNQLANRVFANPPEGVLRQEHVTYRAGQNGQVTRHRLVRIYYGESYQDHSETEVISPTVDEPLAD
jgi:hypothetical protein